MSKDEKYIKDVAKDRYWELRERIAVETMLGFPYWEPDYQQIEDKVREEYEEVDNE